MFKTQRPNSDKFFTIQCPPISGISYLKVSWSIILTSDEIATMARWESINENRISTTAATLDITKRNSKHGLLKNCCIYSCWL